MMIKEVINRYVGFIGKQILCLGVVLSCLFSCSENKQTEIPLLDPKAFSADVDGKKTSLYTLESGNGIYMQVTNFGARVVTLWTPDKTGKYEDIVLGFENIDRYVKRDGERFLGPVVGRYANRIADGKFELDGVEYQLPRNNNGQCLHGGLKGLDGVVWEVDSITFNEIYLSYFSPAWEEGFPGNLTFTIVYSLTPENEFKISYKAVSDAPTVINLSHHGLFNLKGEGNGTITDHLLTINASHITPVNKVLIPTGEIIPVNDTPFDFQQARVIGDRIDNEDEQLKYGAGYDHNWVIDRTSPVGIEQVATLYEPASGRVMEVWSDQPGIQFYSGNFFQGTTIGKYGKSLKYREGLALETQKFPDSPNHSHFPSTRLDPGEEYTHTCIYKFSTKLN